MMQKGSELPERAQARTKKKKDTKKAILKYKVQRVRVTSGPAR